MKSKKKEVKEKATVKELHTSGVQEKENKRKKTKAQLKKNIES